MSYHVKYLHLDGESSLQNTLDDFAVYKGFRIERTGPRTPEQNGQPEVNGRWIILNARAFAIEANPPQNLGPQLVVTVVYIMNRTSSKRLGWKTLFECIYGYKPPLAQLEIIGSKVYALKKNKPRLENLLAGAHESTNIYKVWVPSLGRIIDSRDVNIDSGNLYDPHHLDAVAIKEISQQEVIQALELPTTLQDPLSQKLEDYVVDEQNNLFSDCLEKIKIGKNTVKNQVEGSVCLELSR
ncbi:Copia protein [Golovinomyces cichoracearum]|uniref:Copia protein n=1 Tax=Golovinomyces cichoracearum TaxID=62708 RepID=A0A420I9D5_9PEZI|nr:Copia protein [Golovinomyces cichoracearum]